MRGLLAVLAGVATDILLDGFLVAGGLAWLALFIGGMVAGAVGGRRGWLWGLLTTPIAALLTLPWLFPYPWLLPYMTSAAWLEYNPGGVWLLMSVYAGLFGGPLGMLFSLINFLFGLEAALLGGWLGERLWRRIRRRTAAGFGGMPKEP